VSNRIISLALVGCVVALAIPGPGAWAQVAPSAPPSPAPGASPPGRPPGARPARPAVSAPAVERRLLDAVRRTPDSFEAQHALGEFYLQAGRLAAAIPHLERARTIDPAHYANGYDLALAYLESGALAAAREQAQTMIAARETGELLNLLGDIEARSGNFAAAAVGYQRAAHLQPTEDHLFDWGDNLLRLRAYDDAADVFTASLRRHPASSRLHVGLGIAHYSRGRHEDAVGSFGRAADLSPADPRPHVFLGEMYGVAPAQADEITRRLARFVARKPRDADGQYYYAMSLWRGAATGDADLARVEALLRKAAALDRTHAKARLQLGILLSEQRRWREAIGPLRACIALEPALAQAHFRLSQAYRRTGQEALADQALAAFESLQQRDAAAPVTVPD
jgi:tetratricopeptide (TPR) repeat protein